MSRPKEGSREIDEGIIVSEAMDWCNSPLEPVPYRIWAKQVDAADLANSVRQTDDRSHVKNSLVLRSYGDEPGTGGGVISGTTGAECTPKTWSETVFAQGQNMVRHDDEWWMNHKNTYGRLTYVKDTNGYPTPDPQLIKAKMQVAGGQDQNTATDAPVPGAGSTGGAEPGVTTGAGVGGIALPAAGAGAAGAGAAEAAPGLGAVGTGALEVAPPVAVGTGLAVGGGALSFGAAELFAAGHNANMTILEGPNLSAPGPPTIDQIDKVYAKSQAQALAKAQVKPVSWVRITQNPCAQFACPPAVGPYKGGSYLCTKGGKTQGHHTPAASVSYLPYSAGPSIQMDPAEHELTASYGPTSRANMYRTAQSSAISSGNFMGAVAMDVNDIHSKFGDKYDSAIAQMTAYAECLKLNEYVR